MSSNVIAQLESEVGSIDQEINSLLAQLVVHRDTIDRINGSVETLIKRRQEYIDALDLLDELQGNKA